MDRDYISPTTLTDLDVASNSEYILEELENIKNLSQKALKKIHKFASEKNTFVKYELDHGAGTFIKYIDELCFIPSSVVKELEHFVTHLGTPQYEKMKNLYPFLFLVWSGDQYGSDRFESLKELSRDLGKIIESIK